MRTRPPRQLDRSIELEPRAGRTGAVQRMRWRPHGRLATTPHERPQRLRAAASAGAWVLPDRGPGGKTHQKSRTSAVRPT